MTWILDTEELAPVKDFNIKAPVLQCDWQQSTEGQGITAILLHCWQPPRKLLVCQVEEELHHQLDLICTVSVMVYVVTFLLCKCRIGDFFGEQTWEQIFW